MIRRYLLGGTPNRGATDLGLLLLRLFAGLALALAHGMGKIPPSEGFIGRVAGMGIPAPVFFAWMAGLAEFGGGLLLAIGLLTRPVSLLLIFHFTFVALVAHVGDPFRARELAIFFLFTAVLYLLSGGGRYSVDGLLRGWRP